ncbi:MAG TPA: DUF305 domain-containing protein [Candidatus Dormibacteraeota bacterium]|nr:DUF305 domain-containing protein [Candidatus Dormibacteraeota bacterium]
MSDELEGPAMRWSLTDLRSLATRTYKPAFTVVAAVVSALVLVGCGSNGQRLAAAVSSSHPATASSTASSFNDADVMFAQQMILHHQQAIEMAQMAPSHAQNPKVKELAAKIEAAQAPEIKTMTGWLHAWGKPVPTAMPGMMSPMPGMMGSPAPGMSGAPVPGMMTQQEMAHLNAAHGAHFDHLFLQMMIRHHQGAVEMARIELAEGVNPAAKKLARQIETSQTAQIAQMRRMLKQ